jgi:excisionase family DNA binding protein
VEQYLSVRELAELLGVSQKTVRGWVYKGLLSPIKAGPRLIRFKRNDVEQWISSNKGENYGGE